jgi:hypothetical protein
MDETGLSQIGETSHPTEPRRIVRGMDSFKLSVPELVELHRAIDETPASGPISLRRLDTVLVADYRLQSGDAMSPEGNPYRVVLVDRKVVAAT